MDPRTKALYDKYGVSPETHDLDVKSGKFIPKGGGELAKEATTATTPAPQPGQRLPRTPFGTFVMQAAEGVVPSLTAAAGGGLGVVAGAPLGPLGQIGAGVLGGVGGGMAGDIGQRWALKKFAPEFAADWEEQAVLDAQTNPKSAFAGRLVSGLAGNKWALGKNLSAARSLLQPGALPAATKQALAQQGVNAGVGVGMQTAQDAADPNQDMSLGRSLAAGAANLALGSPRSLPAKPGKLLSRLGNPKMAKAGELLDQDPTAATFSRAAAARPHYGQGSLARPVPDSVTTTRTQVGDMLNPESTRKVVLITANDFTDQLPAGTALLNTPYGEVWYNPAKISEADLQARLAAPEAQKDFPADLLGMSQTSKPAGGDIVVEAKKGGAEASAEVVNSSDPGAVAAAKTAAEAASPGADVDILPADDVLNARIEENNPYLVRAKRGDAGLPTGNMAEDGVTPATVDEQARINAAQREISARKIGETGATEADAWQYQAGEKPKPVKPKANITQAWKDFWKGTALRDYGVTTREEGAITMPDGRNARGASQAGTRTQQLDPIRATYDTQPHEIFHQLVTDVAANGTSGEKRFIQRALAAFGGDEEALTQAAGEALVDRVKGTGVLQDVLDFARYKLTGTRSGPVMKRLAAGMLDRGRGSAEMGAVPPDMAGVKYQPAGSDKLFATDAEKEFMASDTPFNLRPDKAGTYSSAEILAAFGRLNKAEQALYGPVKEWLAGTPRVTKQQLLDKFASDGPQLEIKELDATPKVSEAEIAYNKMRHEWLETLPTDTQNAIKDYFSDGRSANEFIADFNKGADVAFVKKLKEFAQLQRAVNDESWERHKNKNDSATARYPMVNPRELKDMPGAVDILVRIPRRSRDTNKSQYGDSRDALTVAPPLYPASDSHYPQSGDNLLTHVRAYEHTLPDGRRVLRVFEVQSDWAQQRAKEVKEIEKRRLTNEEDYFRKYFNIPETASHPLHPHTNKLGLKAAMEIARRRGLDGVVIDDAETAMLTEGHDRAARYAGQSHAFPSQAAAQRFANTPEGGGGSVVEKDGRWYVYATQPVILQEGGMRANYDPAFSVKSTADGSMLTDNRFPTADDANRWARSSAGGRLRNDQFTAMQGDLHVGARDLSGVEGVPVELGEHKNVYEGGPADHSAQPRRVRPDLIFRNPDGTPKTTSTGRFYPLGKIANRRGIGEPFSMTGAKYQPDDAGESQPYNPRRSPTAGPAQTLMEAKNPIYRAIGEAGNTAMHNKREFFAKWNTPVQAAVAKLTPDEKPAMRQYLLDAFNNRDETDVVGSENLRQAVAAFRNMYRAIREASNAAGLNVRTREGKERPGALDPVGMPHMIDQQVHDTLKNEVGTEKWNQLVQEFFDYNRDLLADRPNNKLSDADIASILEAKIKHYSGGVSQRIAPWQPDGMSRALRMAQLTKLPDSWVEKDIGRLWERYTGKVATDLAQWINFERDPQMRARLGFNSGAADDDTTTPPVSGHRAVEALMTAFNPPMERKSAGARLAGNLASAANAGLVSNPATRMTDLVTTPFRALSFTGPLKLPSVVVNAAMSAGRAWKAGQMNGNIKPGTQFLDNSIGGAEMASGLIKKGVGALSKGTGSEAIENASRLSAQIIGRGVVDTMAPAALNGDASARGFFRELGTDWPELLKTQDGRDTLAARVAGHVQGFYDGQNLPLWTNNRAKPFVALMRWSIEQTNNFKRFQLRPLLENGDAGPLLTYIAMMGIGGLAAAEVREKIKGLKSYIPTFKEIANAPDESRGNVALAQKLTNLANIAGAFGIYSQLADMAVSGLAGQPINEINVPAVELANEAIKHIGAASAAIGDGADPVVVGGELLNNLAKQTISSYRILNNWMSGKADVKDAKRDYKVFRRLSGDPQRTFAPITGYGRLDEREFDETEDIGEARRLSRQMLREAGGPAEREKKRQSLRSLGGGQIGPRAGDRKEMREYERWLLNTQDPEDARARAQQVRRAERLRRRKLDVLK